MLLAAHCGHHRPRKTFSGSQETQYTMSEHDDTLLDEDLGDDEYDLGNDEEEALLADDFDLERQSSYKGEEETDDVLDLGVTDALDDLDGEDENIEFSRSKNDKNNENDFYEDGDHPGNRSTYYEQNEHIEYKNELQRKYEEHLPSDCVNMSSNFGKGDLREKLQKNAKVYAGNGQGLEDDDCEEAKERRNRFQNERTIISPKMNNNIPDTLENVVTPEPSKLSYRGRGRGRGTRGCRGGGGGGGRFNTQGGGNFNPRFGNMRNMNFDNQPPACRPPLLETRPPFLLGLPNNLQNQQLIYQQGNPQVQPFQHFSPNQGPHQGPAHFVENRPQFPPNQFQNQVGPRVLGPRLDFGPRGGLAGSMQGPPFNCPPSQPPFAQLQVPPGPFQNPGGMMQDNPGRHMQSNQGPLLQGNSGGSLLGNPNQLGPGAPSAGLLQGNQALPLQGFPRQQPSSQGPPINHPNVQIANQSPFENRPPFQEAPFDSRPVYDSRSGYSDQVPTSQFNSNTLPVPQHSASNVPNVPLPPGHKILINPHFRGAVQPTNNARLAWDSAQQQATPSSQGPGGQFSQSSLPYQNQPSYSQNQQGIGHYQQNYQQNKSDDPYAYFSDVWQENKPQKTQISSPTKQYTPEYRENTYDCEPKYKSDSPWEPKDSYQEDRRGLHQSYRDRNLPPKPRNDHLMKSRALPSSAYHDDGYDHNHTPKSPGSRPLNNTTVRGIGKPLPKRSSEPIEKPLRDSSPKRMKITNRNLQEVRTVETLSNANTEKKEEDSDPEMQEYRKKMEEQKRLREKILREKENRRKKAAMEKQHEETKSESHTASSVSMQQDIKPGVLMGAAKDVIANKGHPGLGKGRGRPISIQATEAGEKPPGMRIIRTIQTVPSNDMLDSTETTGQSSDYGRGLASGTRRIVIQKPLPPSQMIATTIQKTVSNLQKGQLMMQNKLINTVQTSGQKMMQSQAGTLKKLTAFGQKNAANTQRIVTQKNPGTLQKTIINVQEVTNANAQKVVVNTQNSQRVVLQKSPLQQKKLPEIRTNTVKLENLAASTSEAQIRRMCQGIGTIESIQMGERSATIVFKTQPAAMVFHKKYQRKMLDLSLITVRLVPQSSGPKSTSMVAKVS